MLLGKQQKIKILIPPLIMGPVGICHNIMAVKGCKCNNKGCKSQAKYLQNNRKKSGCFKILFMNYSIKPKNFHRTLREGIEDVDGLPPVQSPVV